jgi:hypothetical protein
MCPGPDRRKHPRSYLAATATVLCDHATAGQPPAPEDSERRERCGPDSPALDPAPEARAGGQLRS